MRIWVELVKELLNDGQASFPPGFESLAGGVHGEWVSKCAVDGADGGKFIGQCLTQINFRQWIAPWQRRGLPA